MARKVPKVDESTEPVAGAMSDEAIAYRLFGDLAPDVLLLRSHGHTVAKFRGDFRVDREVLRYDQVQAMAAALRARPSKDSRSPARATSAKQPSSNAAVVPTRKDGKAGERDPAVTCPHCAALSKRIDQLFAVVADAITGRHDCLVEQAAGLEQLVATLRPST